MLTRSTGKSARNAHSDLLEKVDRKLTSGFFVKFHPQGKLPILLSKHLFSSKSDSVELDTC